jgi:hypothetical protein
MAHVLEHIVEAEMTSRFVLLLALILFPGFSILGHAKCVCLLITIQVEVRGELRGEQSVMAVVDPDSVWSFQLAGSTPNHFVIQVPFDTYSGTGPGNVDRCKRTPRTISIRLQDWLQGVDEVDLKFPKDFVSKPEGYYQARKTVTLDVNHAGPPFKR